MRKRELLEVNTRMWDLLGVKEANEEILTERLASLELALEDVGWNRLDAGFDTEFDRGSLRTICNLSRLAYLKNPLINHGVEVQAHYVFGQGLDIAAEDEEVDVVWQKFWNDRQNRKDLTTDSKLALKEFDLQLDGNLFFALFGQKLTGAVRLRTIPVNEISDIITNPEDAKDPWFYLRQPSARQVLYGGLTPTVAEPGAGQVLYPDVAYNPPMRPKSWNVGGRTVPVNWDVRVYHVKVGCKSDMRFGVPEVYSALDWSKAAKNALEDYATVRRAHADFAKVLKVGGGAKAVAAGKAKLATTVGTGSGETNPPPPKGSTAIVTDAAALQAFMTRGAQDPPEEARMLFVMAGAGMGLPYSILTGDADKSNLATAKSLDRPTELRFQMRRMLWKEVFQDIGYYLIERAVRAPRKQLRGKFTRNEWGEETLELEKDPDTGEPRSQTITADFPPILEHDISESVSAIVTAATLDGKAPSGVMDSETLSRLLLTTLGVKGIEEVLQRMEEEATEEGEAAVVEVAYTEAIRKLGEATNAILKEVS